MNLTRELAGGRPVFRMRLGVEPIGTPGNGCHAGAGHGQSIYRGAFGALCQPCWESVCRILGRAP